MSTTIAVFTRDLRVNDNPMLAAAAHAERTVPMFVLDPAAARAEFTGPARHAFLTDCLHDLDAALRRTGARLVIRHGDAVHEIIKLAEQVDAVAVHIAEDVSAHAARRQQRLRRALAAQRRELVTHAGAHTVVPPGALLPAGGDHYAVFTPYWRRWTDSQRRAPVPAPARLVMPRLTAGRLPLRPHGDVSLRGGETAGRRRAAAWLRDGLSDYAEVHDLLAADGTSRLSPYLHLGCISAVELAERAAARQPDARLGRPDPFLRQLAWRDFHHQVLAARPDAAHADYRPRGDNWRDDPEALAAWQAGATGYPIVDAGMRQLAAQAWMHNRARLITASFLTKLLYLDWRAGARHYFGQLLDGDLANNCLNWQWIAGTGTDTRPNRVLNPLRQAERYDPDGEYVRRWVPELAHLPNRVIHQPWSLPEPERRRLRYPAPLIDLAAARDRFRHARERRHR